MEARKFCVPLIYAEELTDGTIHSTGGTALLLVTGSGRFLVTATHVWSELVRRSNQPGGRMAIMISNGHRYLSVRDAQYIDEVDDVIVLSSANLSAAVLEKNHFYSPPTWPIPPAVDGEILGVTGFPGDYRKIHGRDINPGSWHIECPCIVGSGGRYLIPGISHGAERESVPHVDSPPPLNDIGGSSGAPAFAWRDGKAVLVGIVTDGTENGGVQSTLWISSLARLNEDGQFSR
jgi:hypothetical protein